MEATRSAATSDEWSFEAPPFGARGPVSEQLLAAFRRPAADADETLAGLPVALADAIAATDDIARDDDLQLSLLLLHGLHYGSVVDADEEWEWHPSTVAARVAIERAFEHELRERVGSVAVPSADAEAVAAALFKLTKPTPGPSVARFVAKQATDEQAREYVVLRSVYTLKEADAQTWSIPRLSGRAKAALVEIQADEYGGGRPERMHSAIFARTMRELGLDDRYGAYLDAVPAITIASFNMMSMFGLNRRLRGASAGHYAAYEMTSSLPNRMLGDGFRRLGYGEEVTDYFDEHVEADAVHEQIAGRDLAGGLAEHEPSLVPDIMFGAVASMMIDGWAAERTLDAWTAGRSALREAVDLGRSAQLEEVS
ncbi:iron-containing redox enzyme family protein [Agrococcus lahaulensis]|uniref:iron-containing redox enzyme family protein n=1 Tax=Agrococcus lahaulensis TaxID=341722 RepID=UPI001B7FBF35|nr:iron-containing redox enzyme family protein [Agrococcus lahaulensis]